MGGAGGLDLLLKFFLFCIYLFVWAGGGIFGPGIIAQIARYAHARLRAMRGGRIYFLWFCTQRPPPFAQT